MIEIWPRVLTGPVNKTREDERATYLRSNYRDLASDCLSLAVSSDDAFDAAVSALKMAAHVDELTSLGVADDPVLRLEGEIWYPRDSLRS